MPSVTPKRIAGHTYYYARYSQRVNGKPKVVRTVYLGKASDLVAAVEQARQPAQPLETEVAAFGDVAALFDIARQLDLVPLLDSILPAKRHQNLSPGQYLLLAALNRAVRAHQQAAVRRLVPPDGSPAPAPGRPGLALLAKLLEPHGSGLPGAHLGVRATNGPAPAGAVRSGPACPDL